MYPHALHLYGPFMINGYNGAIIFGIIVFLFAALRNPARKSIIGSADFINLSAETGVAAIIGARLLHVLSDWHSYQSWMDVIAIWQGGLSILGGLIGALTYSSYFMYKKGLPILAIYSLAAMYPPLIHGIARIGCFLIGCCHGCPTEALWGVTYTNPLSHAPLNVKLHPAQLYSSLFYFALFFILRYYIAPRTKLFSSSGNATKTDLKHRNLTISHYPYSEATLVIVYLMGMSLERFIVDFFRGDRIMETHGALSILSFHQWTALTIFTGTLLVLIISRLRTHGSNLNART